VAVSIRELSPEDWQAWNEFVFAHAHGSPFHLTAWKNSIQATFGYIPKYVLAAEGNVIRGVLPLFLVDNLVVGRTLLSSPFAVYGGILADSKAVAALIYEHAIRLGRALDVDYIELRNSHAEQCVGKSNIGRYVTFTQPAQVDESELFETLPKKTRNMVRKSLRYPYESRIQTSDFRNFEELYARNMHRLGTPSFPSQHFAELKRNFNNFINVREIALDGKVVAASFNFYFRDQMHLYYAASDPSYQDKAVNNFLYWDSIGWAGQQGFRTFDFGRCKRGTGVFEFKRHWAATMRELPYEVILLRRKHVPNYSPLNPKFRLAIEVWKSLPLAVARIVGPQLIRLFP
jgi:FemAB-related protein (PEP-CTERM system-associated)